LLSIDDSCNHRIFFAKGSLKLYTTVAMQSQV
jgi:hypothetical protein